MTRKKETHPMKLYVHGMPIELPSDDPTEVGEFFLANYQREDIVASGMPDALREAEERQEDENR